MSHIAQSEHAYFSPELFFNVTVFCNLGNVVNLEKPTIISGMKNVVVVPNDRS